MVNIISLTLESYRYYGITGIYFKEYRVLVLWVLKTIGIGGKWYERLETD